MSGEDQTQDISKKYDTKPTIETVLERINVLAEEMRKGFAAINVRLDRVESLAHTTRGEMLALRADFTELRDTLKEHIPSIP